MFCIGNQYAFTAILFLDIRQVPHFGVCPQRTFQLLFHFGVCLQRTCELNRLLPRNRMRRRPRQWMETSKTHTCVGSSVYVKKGIIFNSKSGFLEREINQNKAKLAGSLAARHKAKFELRILPSRSRL